MDLISGKKISTFFKSRKLATVLITLIILLSIIGTYIPQKSQLKTDVYNAWKTNHPGEAQVYETLGLTDLFSSVIFLSVALLLFLNTLFCTNNILGNAFMRLNERFQKKEYISRLENSTLIHTSKEQNSVISLITSEMRTMGYKVSQEKNFIHAEKNRFGTLGTPVFHLCILFIILSALYGSTGRMEGDMRLIEGQTLSEDHGNYMFINEGPLFNENHQKFDITLEKFYPDYYDVSNIKRGGAGKLVIKRDGKVAATDIVYSNHLMTYGGYTFLGNVYGMAPLLTLRNPDGSVISGSYITASDTDDSKRYVAVFDIGDTGLEGGLMVYMTSNLTSGNIAEGNAEQTPLLLLKIFDGENQIFDGKLGLNDAVQIGDKYLVFSDIKYWSNYYIVKDDGTTILYAGFALITLSLSVMFFIIPKRLWVEITSDEKTTASEIHIGGRTDRFRSLYEEEYCSLIEHIKERLSNGTD
jgi:cytochrome c biogenesis protein ResB